MQSRVRTICFDLDGVICTQTTGDYDQAVPNQSAIAAVNRLYDQGYRIVIHTSRFMGRAGENPINAYRLGYAYTIEQLKGWGVRYHELFMGKPRYDVVIDDRAVFYQPNWHGNIEELLATHFQKT